MNRATGCSSACTKRYSPQTQSGTPSVATTGERSRTERDGSSASGSPVYPHVGVDASGLATLRATVLDLLRGFVPTAYAVPALAAAAAPIGPCYALADGSAAVGRRGRSTGAAPARRPAADSDSARMMDLVERAQAGEADAFGRLYDQYSDTVYRSIYYPGGGKATAEDLTSETFLRALRRIGTFTWQGRDFGAWLVTIARNLVADHYKPSRVKLEVSTADLLDLGEAVEGPEQELLESLTNQALFLALRRLGSEQQE